MDGSGIISICVIIIVHVGLDLGVMGASRPFIVNGRDLGHDGLVGLDWVAKADDCVTEATLEITDFICWTASSGTVSVDTTFERGRRAGEGGRTVELLGIILSVLFNYIT